MESALLGIKVSDLGLAFLCVLAGFVLRFSCHAYHEIPNPPE